MSLNYIKFVSTRGVATNVLNIMTAEQVLKQLQEARAEQEMTIFVGQEEEISDDKKAFVIIDPMEIFSVTVRSLANVKDAMKAQEKEQQDAMARQRLAIPGLG